ncbi:hypothetical protein HDU82_005789 [Entophlyctis luteolus]|nr:hypothetical protein HDU82_005789 [Entophlyctis luteolus]
MDLVATAVVVRLLDDGLIRGVLISYDPVSSSAVLVVSDELNPMRKSVRVIFGHAIATLEADNQDYAGDLTSHQIMSLTEKLSLQ